MLVNGIDHQINKYKFYLIIDIFTSKTNLGKQNNKDDDDNGNRLTAITAPIKNRSNKKIKHLNQHKCAWVNSLFDFSKKTENLNFSKSLDTSFEFSINLIF